MRNIRLLIGLAVLSFTACQSHLPEANYDVIPQPKEVVLNTEKPFVLQSSTVVYYENGLQREAEFLSEYIDDILGFAPTLRHCEQNEVERGNPEGIVLCSIPEDFDHAEAYEITVTPKQVLIKGADAAGVFYGVQTIRKSLPILKDNSQHLHIRH